jgi:predicted transcriptional regulator
MIDELNKRIIEVMVRTEHSKSTFAKTLDVSLPLITHITTGRNKPGLDLIQKLLTHFEDISPDWLLLGTGSMHREKPKAVDFSPVIEQLDTLATEIEQVEQSQQRIIQYHKMLMDEMLHLKELDESILTDTQKLGSVKDRLKGLKEQLKSKL